MTLFKWMPAADVDAGTEPGVTGTVSAELREARKRLKLLAQENEVLRRAAASLSQAFHPARGVAPPLTAVGPPAWPPTWVGAGADCGQC
ncbi:hypothetical protein GCM10010432_10040 [Catellatospora methionotrophica]